MNTMILILTVVCSFLITALLGKIIIPWLRKLNFGQTILDIGPRWHKSKEGTPTMGGLMFIPGIIIAIIIGTATFALSKAAGEVRFIRLFSILFLAICFGLIGFMDDYVKVAKKRNLGLTATQKLILQFAAAIAYIATLRISGCISTIIPIPFIGQLDFGIFYYPIAVILIVGFCNGANLTDGVDGLLSGVTFVSGLALTAICAIVGAGDSEIVAAALVGGCLGFLVWNFYPAKVFMGDTGSMFLGAMVTGLCFAAGQPFIIFFVGLIYWLEALSDILQWGYFKITHGKRLFKMAPIHHHFEMSGWSEIKVVLVFSFVQMLGCIAAILSMIFAR